MKSNFEELFHNVMRLCPDDFTQKRLYEKEPEMMCLMKEVTTGIDKKDAQDALILVEAVLERCWERLNTGVWSSVSTNCREIYAFASYLKALLYIKNAVCDISNANDLLLTAVKAADYGLLMGDRLRDVLIKTANELLNYLNIEYRHNVTVYDEVNCDANISQFTDVGVAVDEVDDVSLERFFTRYFKRKIPVKIKGSMSHWPALKLWPNIEYLYKKIGPRTVPVEVGSHYASSSWSQKLMTVSEFIEQYIMFPSENAQKGYLAQHQLFHQIPELLSDIRQPEFCCVRENYEIPDADVDVNVWFGPANTISCLHYDPRHNLLSQVFGKKRIILHSPSETENLYPHEESLLHNTAQVNPLEPDFTRFPNYKRVQTYTCILNPGEMLYIPKEWWHHVISLTPSFSISFWWDT